jgi:hypothetical protein
MKRPEARVVLDHLRRSGPATPRQLQTALGIPKSTMQRRVAVLGKELLVVGKARATQYAARRTITSAPSTIPIFEVDEKGDRRHLLTLHPVELWGHYVEAHAPDVVSGFVLPETAAATDLPWFLSDATPSGFLGRLWVRAHTEHGFPPDLNRWSGDDTLRYALHYGTDLPGSLVVGHVAMERARMARHRPGIEASERTAIYPRLADQTIQGDIAESSAGGEQAKFVALVEGMGHRLVKFSPPMKTPTARRWADLLTSEHVAHEILREHGIESARSEVFDAGGRRFLDVERFDRHGRAGRSGLVSLLAFDELGVGSDLRSWSIVAGRLRHRGVLDATSVETAGWLESFGHLIANTDMHLANISLRVHGTTILGLAPVYDMVPMFHAPRAGGELVRALYDPRVERDSFPDTARSCARAFWDAVIDRGDVSRDFKTIARTQRDLVP